MDTEHDSLLDFPDRKFSKNVLYTIIAGVILVVIAAAVVTTLFFTNVIGPSSLSAKLDSKQPATPPRPFTPFLLPPSSPQTLLHLLQTDDRRDNGDYPIVARSYEGYPWEPVPDADRVSVDIDCSGNACVVLTPGTYTVKNLTVPSFLTNASKIERLARLINQGTFGTSLPTLRAALTRYDNNFVNWINDQMQLPPTYLRSYYRQRVQPRLRGSTNLIGAAYSPCEVGSRWTQYAFNFNDEGSLITVEKTGTTFTLKSGNITRTVVTNAPFPATTTYPARFTLCDVSERVNGNVRFTDTDTIHDSQCRIVFPNPPILFSRPDPNTVQQLPLADATLEAVAGRPNAFILTRISASLTRCNPPSWSYIQYNNTFYRFDPRLKLIENSLENPTTSSSSAFIGVPCPAPAKTFVNKDSCQRRPSCSPLTFTPANVVLNFATLSSWYRDGLYVYAVTGLQLDDPKPSPCGAISRWLRSSGPCPSVSGIDPTTLRSLTRALTDANGEHPNLIVLDITVVTNCSRTTPGGIYVPLGNQCFQHVHEELYSVRDFNFWATGHDGNKGELARNNPNPITKWAENNTFILNYPFSSHGMQRWKDRDHLIPAIGIFGDTVDFRNLPASLQTASMAIRVGAASNRSNAGFEACGARAENMNVPTFGHRYQIRDNGVGINYPLKFKELDFPVPFESIKSVVWTNVVVKADDQLRQKVAWALAQILTVSGASSSYHINSQNEIWLTFYDIFVRNAFGNYRDVLREVSFSPAMAWYLSFSNNRAYAVSGRFPDENYAREIMQLFSLGLWKLDDNGKQLLDSDGHPIITYSNDDIVDFARLWTGLSPQQMRSNIEAATGVGSTNNVDPLDIKPFDRDLLPKAKLDEGYLGDTYPICDDLPPQHWLKKGAKYVFTGATSLEGPKMDREEPLLSGIRGRFAPNPTSQLYALLCQRRTPGSPCSFPSEVNLTTNIPCEGQECNAGRVITVKIYDPVARVTQYYTYVSTPCVRLTFHQGVFTSRSGRRQCTNPKAKVAGPLCCSGNRVNHTNVCLFANEAMDFATARARCRAAGNDICSSLNLATTFNNTCSAGQFVWSNISCTLSVQVFSTGQISIIDAAAPRVYPHIVATQNSLNIFRVRWNNGIWPDTNNCGPNCTSELTSNGPTCICPLVVSEAPVFTNPSVVPTAETVAKFLFIGAADPTSFDNTYIRCTTPACNANPSVGVWVRTGTTAWDATTIFELPPPVVGAPKIFLANVLSMVTVAGSYSFRNPPHFMPLVGDAIPLNADEWFSAALYEIPAQYETDAGLDHFFRHPSTAPFISLRLIQRLVTSNPSPRYMREVVKAFRTGVYKGTTYGTYGDLKATVMAILLDPEARSTVIEADPTFGRLQEPLVKVIQLMRSMQYISPTVEVMVPFIFETIGQEAFQAPTVFGFYLPDNRIEGPTGEKGLFSPEGQLAITPYIIGAVNGLVSLVDHGLTSCNEGYGWDGSGDEMPTIPPNCNLPDGNLTYTPTPNSSPAQVVQELSLLLTSGRLNPTARNYITDRYRALLPNTNAALRLAQKLILTTPEFHVPTANIPSGNPRKVVPQPTFLDRPYKAIVIVFLDGGADTYSFLMPHSNCGPNNNNDLYNEFKRVRQDTFKFYDKTNILPINVPAGSQPCSTMALHQNLTSVRDMYNAGQAAFLANIGALIEPITKDQFHKRTRAFPANFMAHDVGTRYMNTLDPQNNAAQGVLGRMMVKLQSGLRPYKCDLYSLMGTVRMLQGSPIPVNYIDPKRGITRFLQASNLGNDITNLTKDESTGSFSETWATLLRNSIAKTEALGSQLANTVLTTRFPQTNFANQLEQVAKFIQLRTYLETERAIFVTRRPYWDSHATLDLTGGVIEVDTALGAFKREMVSQGMWDNVAVLTVSEFGRTLTPNSGGTDHGWGGNHVLLGGAVKGGKVFGKYPTSFGETGPELVGRGIFIPSTPWEGIWNGLADWFGVNMAEIEDVLPNVGKFKGTGSILSGSDLFKN